MAADAARREAPKQCPAQRCLRSKNSRRPKAVRREAPGQNPTAAKRPLAPKARRSPRRGAPAAAVPSAAEFPTADWPSGAQRRGTKNENPIKNSRWPKAIRREAPGPKRKRSFPPRCEAALAPRVGAARSAEQREALLPRGSGPRSGELHTAGGPRQGRHRLCLQGSGFT